MSVSDPRELSRILAEHARRYPLMGPADGVKLIFQNEFGGGHLIPDPGASLERLRAERGETAFDPAAPLFEEIGGGMVRVTLAALDGENYPLDALNRDFVRSAQLHTGSRKRFLAKLGTLEDLTRGGLFRFSPEELDAYLKPYIDSGCPPVSHSSEYRRAYGPAYRVVQASASLPHLLEEISRRCAQQAPVLVALDGRCASGKTTLAARLCGDHGWGLVHMDHFFLRPEQRTPERYAAPGGNIDHERFLAQVLRPLREGRTPEYRPFDCRTQRLGEPIRLKTAPVTVVEGSYSCHPALWDCYDLRVFLSAAPEKQRERIVARDGVEYAEVFRTKWIPLEERYFSACQIESRCDYCLEV